MENDNAYLERVRRIISSYYGRRLFIFLPNLCNAKCYFCYIKPAFSRAARIPASTIESLGEFLKSARELGFQEIRLTGAEPLVFENIGDIIETALGNDMEYTLLTNGVNLGRHMGLILAKRPSKVTVSFHSVHNHHRIFGIDSNVSRILGKIRILSDANINVTVTIVFLPENVNEVVTLLRGFSDSGIRSFKLVYPNINDVSLGISTRFKNIVEILENAEAGETEVRFTDLSHSNCELKNIGLLSLSTPDFRLFPCCAVVPYGRSYKVESFKTSNLARLFMGLFKKYMDTTVYPCKSYISVCPLSLKTKSVNFQNAFGQQTA